MESSVQRVRRNDGDLHLMCGVRGHGVGRI